MVNYFQRKWGERKQQQEEKAAQQKAQRDEQALIVKAYLEMASKLQTISELLCAHYDDSTHAAKKEQIREPIKQLIEALEKTRDKYVGKKINSQTLKTEWEEAIQTHMETIDKLHDPDDVSYHEMHEHIQAFLKWANSILNKIGLGTKGTNPHRKAWIQEQTTSVSLAEEVKAFRKDLEPPEDATKQPVGTPKKH
ncbi:MAG: hypothetical protein P1U32_04245 [Legionellaceae bacterium]|nr:hypothetical protein [Legionellaceae bacterium]